jgi:hypothetical protein
VATIEGGPNQREAQTLVEIATTLLLDDEHMAPPVELSDGSRFPGWAEVWATVDGTPVTLTLRVEDGRPILDTFYVTRPRAAHGPLRATTIHALPVDRIVAAAIEQIRIAMDRFEGAADAKRLAVQAYGRRRITDELLREVADVVRADRLQMPNQAVQTKLHTSSRNASRWITAARERGFLDDNEGSQQ